GSDSAPGMAHLSGWFIVYALSRYRRQGVVGRRAAWRRIRDSSQKDHCMKLACSLVLAAAIVASLPLAAQDDDGARADPSHPLLRTVDQIARQAPTIRGLELRENVRTDVMDRPQLEALMQKMMREEYPPEMIELAEK